MILRTFRRHPILTAAILLAFFVGGVAVGWDRVDPGPEQIRLELHAWQRVPA